MILILLIMGVRLADGEEVMNLRGLGLVVLLLAGCGRGVDNRPAAPQPPAPEKPVVTVSIAPQKYFLERLAGDRFEVNVMVPPGIEPDLYEPKPQQLEQLARSQVYFTLGLPFERQWLPKVRSLYPQLLMVDPSQGMQRLPMAEHHHHDHDHDEETQAPASEEDRLDPHVWLSPVAMRDQVGVMADTLERLDPEKKAIYDQQEKQVVQEITELDRDLRQQLAGLKQRKFMVFHPVWGYFARDYNLQMIAIETEGTEPSPGDLAKLIDLGKKEKIQVVFAQPELSQRSADAIAKEIGAQVVLISPLAENWLENLRDLAKQLTAAQTKEKPVSFLLLYPRWV